MAENPNKQKNLEEQLIIKTQELENFFYVNLDLLCIADTDGNFLKVNKEWENILGYSKSELEKRKFLDFVHTEDLEATLEAMSKLGQQEQVLNFVNRYRTKDGLYRYIEWRSQPHGNLIYAAARDITKRIEMEKELLESQERYRQLSEQNRTFTWEVDIDGLYTFVDPISELVIGYSPDEMIRKLHYYDIHPEEGREEFKETAFEVFKKKGSFYSLENPIQTKDGGITWVSTNGLPMLSVDGTLAGYRGSDTDITKRKELELELLKEQKLFETTLLSVGDGVVSTDSQGNITFINKAAETLTGWTKEEAVGKPIEKIFYIFDEVTREKHENLIDKVIASGKIHGLGNNAMLVSKNGVEIPIEDSAAPILQENGEIIGVVVVFRDFSDKKQKQKEVLYLSYHDQLTGLYNRRFYEEELKRLDTKRNLPISIVVADINGLKLINDSFGHAMGDELLQKAAEIIKRGCRADDIVARMGGDEFVMLLPKTDGVKAKQIIDRIKNIALDVKVHSFDISISFGYGTKSEVKEPFQDIFKQAEDFMYRNKLYESFSMRSKTINMIMSTLYEKSTREMLHSQRVGETCETIATFMDFDKNKVNQLKIAGLMHDIGKMGIDEKILNKPEALTDDEWKEMKRHPEIGFRILNSSSEYSEIAKYILQHQERWDGKGYPKGLKGEEISLQARIIAIADAYDAMTSDRTYRNKSSDEEALAELKKNAGTQFDPQIVELFVSKFHSQ